jgi:formylglycine-generating enzyme required for sulfatase activity
MENYSSEIEKFRALRGGSWLNVDSDLRCSARNYLNPGLWYNLIGFRVLRAFAPSH